MLKHVRSVWILVGGFAAIAFAGCLPLDGEEDVAAQFDGGFAADAASLFDETSTTSHAITIGTSRSGFASYHIYDGVPANGVKCNESPKRYNMMVTALRRDLFRSGGATCGKCAKVTSGKTGGGYGKTVTVRIIDESNDFTNNGGKRLLDLSAQAFAKIGDKNRGFIPVSFQIVNCPTGLK